MATATHQLKSNQKSLAAKKNGNSYYLRQKYLEALLCYNEAACFAETDEFIAEAFGNRSAVYFLLKRYKKCLENIDLARNYRYPAEKIEKLNEREKQCKALLVDQKTSPDDVLKDLMKLSYPANEKIPFIVDCLKLGVDKKCGRGIYATRNFKVGDIVAMEEPFVKTFLHETNYYRCFRCFKANMLSLLPCLYSSK